MADDRRREREEVGRVLRRGEAERYDVLRGVETSNGINITSTSKHAINRAVGREFSPSNMINTLHNPLEVGSINVDDLGRASQKFIGRECTVFVNPNNGLITTVYPTKPRILRRYGVT